MQINRKHKVNEKYFDKINSQEKAYWLDFLWADGSIYKTATRSSGNNRLNITQQKSEIDHLKKFKKSINCDYDIKVKRNECRLEINSRYLCKQLEKYGYDIKEKRIHIPNIEPQYIRHFIRGYFDGDGCISIYQQRYKGYNINKQEFSITGNKALLEEIKKEFEKSINTTSNLKFKTYKRTNKAVTLRYGKQADIEKLFYYLYQNSTIHLERKYNNFLKYFSRKSK